nr:hypothetical protein [Streptomyces sp. ISL-100]
MPIGRLIRNTDPHQKWLSSQPPAMGPTTVPTPTAADQMPIAFVRSAPRGKTFPMTASVAGMISASPTPITPRATISVVTDPAYAAATEAAVKRARPVMNTHLRPRRSARLPQNSTRLPAMSR